MIKLCALLMLLVVWSADADAQTRRYLVVSAPTPQSPTVPADAVQNACYFVLIAGRPGGGFSILANGVQDFAYAALVLGLATAPLGTTFTLQCDAIFPTGSGGVNYSATSNVIVSQTCVLGLVGSLIMQTTIASFDVFRRPVAADVMPNPQCSVGCVVQHPTGGAGTQECAGYIAAGVEADVGVSFWVACSQDGIAQTGESCNFASADQQAVTPQAVVPAGALNVNGGTPGTGSGGTGLTVAESAALINISNQSLGIAASGVATVSGVGQVKTAIEGLRGDQASRAVTLAADTASRHSDMMGSLGDMLTALQGLETGGGTFPEGAAITGVVGGLGADPLVEAPPGGLVSPGETEVKSFKDVLNATPDRASGECPVWTMQLDYFNSTYTVNQHCALVDNNRGTLEAVMTVVWSIMALGLVLRA